MKTSEQINDLAAALVQARKAFAPIKKTHTANVTSAKGAYKYTYSTLDDLYEATTAALCAAGVFALHNIETANGVIGVSTRLLHASGQFLETDPVWLPGGSTPQSVGSAITYARRYSLSATLGVAAEEDDDGQQAAVAKGKPATAPAPRPAEAPRAATPTPVVPPVAPVAAGSERVISEAQRKRLFAISKKNHWSEPDMKALLARHGFASSKDITARAYDAIVAAVESGEVIEDREPGDDDDGVFGMAPWEEGTH